MQVIKSHINLLILLSVALVFGACRKDELPDVPNENNPVFNIQGTLGNQSLALHAGKKGAYMDTEVKSWNNVDFYSGRLGSENTSLSISLYPSSIDIPNTNKEFEELSEYEIADPTGVSSLLTLSSEDFEFNQNIENIQWTIDDEPQTTAELNVLEPGKYMVCAEVNFSTGFSESTCNTVIVGYERNADFQLKWNMLGGGTIESYIDAPNSSVEEVQWYLNDEWVSDSIHYLNSGTFETFHLKAVVKFANGTVAEREVFIDRYSKELSIEDYASMEQSTNLRWDNKVQFTIQIDGETYVSVQNGNDDAKLIIDEIVDFDSDEETHQVKVLKGTLNIPFKNTQTQEVIPGDFEVEIGVGY